MVMYMYVSRLTLCNRVEALALKTHGVSSQLTHRHTVPENSTKEN